MDRVTQSVFPSVATLGRLLIAAIFMISGIAKITQWEQTSQYMVAQGIPIVPLALAVAIFIEIAGGLLLLSGVITRQAATMLFVYLIPVTLFFHNFWAYEAGPERTQQLVNLLKNMAIMGGLLQISAFGRSGTTIIHRSATGEVITPEGRVIREFKRTGG